MLSSIDDSGRGLFELNQGTQQKMTLIQLTEMTLYQHCWLAIFVMLIWRPNIYWLVISDLLDVKKNTQKWNSLVPHDDGFAHHEWGANEVWILTILQANTSATHNFEISEIACTFSSSYIPMANPLHKIYSLL